MAATGAAPRRAAGRLLTDVLGQRRLLSEAVSALDPALGDADKARAQRLATTTLRHLDRADWILAQHMRKPPPLAVRNLLRLATVEMLESGAAPHGVVSAAVSIVRAGRKTGHLAGLTNAVLRKVAETPSETWAALPPNRLPNWLRKPLEAQYSAEAVAAIEAAHQRTPPTDLTLKPGADPILADALEAIPLPTGSLRLGKAGQISALPGYDRGEWWVQDAAAALPAQILAAKPGERVLDLCAAPGGKTLQLAAAGADVTALDISATRVARLRLNLARCGLTAKVVVADALVWSPDQAFDAILVDAPCSATGTIRRHPDLPFVKAPSDLVELAELQTALFDRAVHMLRAGGRLVFCTCSLLPAEGEAQLAAALDRHAALRLDEAAFARPGIDPTWRSVGGLRTRPDYWPERGGLDGFFIAAVQKTA